MKKTAQSGFTLVEIAIVLVIIGLLLGGILKGQEMINSAKVKNMATDFRTIPTYIYGYQDKFKAYPGDDPQAAAHISGATTATTPGASQGNGVIDGAWNSNTNTDESFLFWQHVRLAGFAPGPTSVAAADYLPKNADGGRIGIQSGVTPPITNLRGTYIVCSDGVLGKYAKQLDTTIDDGETSTGSMMIAQLSVGPNPIAVGAINDSAPYTVCLGF